MTEFSFHNIHKNFGFKPVLNGLALEVTTGERAALVGANGCGKSTVLRLLAGEESPDQGEISVRRGASIGYLEQMPKRKAPGITVQEVLLEPFAAVFALQKTLRALESAMAEPEVDWEALGAQYDAAEREFTALGGYGVEEQTQRIVQGFRLTGLLDREFNALSGGQKTVVGLAAVVLRQPDILLLDEPTNHLDTETLDWFEGFLAKYRGTVLLVSHDRYFLDRVATRTILLEDGVCESFAGNYSFALQERERLMLLEFEQYKNREKQMEAMRAAIRRFRDWGARGDNKRLFRKAKQLETRLAALEALDRPQQAKPKLPLHFSALRAGQEILKLTDFSLTLGENRLFEKAELLVSNGERVHIAGGNGTGKTSLIRAVLGELPHGGEAVLGPSVRLGYVPQEIRFEPENATVLEAFRGECPVTEGEARGILARYYFYGASVLKRVSTLSGGEKVFLKLAVLMQKRVNFLILDEPTNHIDLETRELLEESLLEFPGTLLFVSHDRYFAEKLAARRVEVRDGGLWELPLRD